MGPMLAEPQALARQMRATTLGTVLGRIEEALSEAEQRADRIMTLPRAETWESELEELYRPRGLVQARELVRSMLREVEG